MPDQTLSGEIDSGRRLSEGIGDGALAPAVSLSGPTLDRLAQVLGEAVSRPVTKALRYAAESQQRIADGLGRDIVLDVNGLLPVAIQAPLKLDLGQSSGNVTSKTVDRGTYRGPCGLVVSSIAGSTPTVALDIKGSVDGANFYNVAYALVATPNTVAIAQITITSTVVTTYQLLTDQMWRYLQVVLSSNTNVALSVTLYI